MKRKGPAAIFTTLTACGMLVSGATQAAYIGSMTHNEDSYNNNNQMTGSRFRANASFTATHMKAYLINSGGKLSMAIYSDSAS